ncbi:hypothetical protein O1611_g1075 [Lasiodiplodia mahajangana]|uniref:Uncharacterized protein n=1 Tax=Lasiodiplodia mahajangana TaxID=1108764 RepID=A0ACC2JZ08_9PEZI|nr:hypothetical protein O1611_g1075 [Lasiodiplodia mahajangana]
MFRKWLERPGNNQWLVIVDGADQEANLRDFHIDKFLNSPINGHVIVTSRILRLGQTIEIQKLEENHAATLLCDIVDLVNKLELLPLAIKQAGAFLSSTNWSVSDYSNSFSSTFPLESKSNTEPSSSPLENTWCISIQELDIEGAELLDTISFLSDNNISVDFIERTIKTIYGPKRALQLGHYLQTLEKYSLIRHDPAAAVVTLDSNMVQWLRRRKQDFWDDYVFRARVACRSLASYLTSTLPGVNPVLYTAKQFRFEEQLLPYLERCVEYVPALSPRDTDLEVLGDVCRVRKQNPLMKPNFCCTDSLTKPAFHHSLRAEVLLEDMHRVECALGPVHIRTLESAILLASQYEQEGEHPKAEIIWRRAYLSYSKTLGDFHPLTLKTASSLANVLGNGCKFEQARALQSSIRHATARVMGEDHPDTLTPMARIAVLWSNQSRFDEADREYRKVLEKMEGILGKDHADVKRIHEHIEHNSILDYLPIDSPGGFTYKVKDVLRRLKRGREDGRNMKLVIHRAKK